MDPAAWMELLRRGEAEGLEGLLRHYDGMLRYIIRGILDDPQEREECLAQVRLKVWESRGQYDPARSTPATWLTALCRNAAVDRLRQLRRRETQPLSDLQADPAPGPEEVLLQKERSQALGRALARLSRRERELFYRKYYYLQSTARIAAELGITERAVEGRLYRVRVRLQMLLGGEL